MLSYLRLSSVLSLAVFTGILAYGQNPDRHTVVNCVKVKEGKNAEYTAYLRDVTKLYKSRVESGEVSAYIIAQAVAPAGRSARCDYHTVTAYTGFPPETGAAGKLDADLKRAGISITAAEFAAKRDSLSDLVGREFWRSRERVGAGSQKGGYIRINYYKVKPGMMTDYLALEATGWKQVAEEMNKQNAGMSWSLASLVMPGGANVAYNAMTVDGFPNWEALGSGTAARPIWNKVHPERDMSAYMNRIAAVSDRPRVEVMRVIEAIRK